MKPGQNNKIMQAKIKFDINGMGYPVIHSEIPSKTEDLRDKVAAKFFEQHRISSFIQVLMYPYDDAKQTKHYELQFVSDRQALQLLRNKWTPMCLDSETEEILNKAFEALEHLLAPE